MAAIGDLPELAQNTTAKPIRRQDLQSLAFGELVGGDAVNGSWEGCLHRCQLAVGYSCRDGGGSPGGCLWVDSLAGLGRSRRRELHMGEGEHIASQENGQSQSFRNATMKALNHEVCVIRPYEVSLSYQSSLLFFLIILAFSLFWRRAILSCSCLPTRPERRAPCP